MYLLVFQFPIHYLISCLPQAGQFADNQFIKFTMLFMKFIAIHIEHDGSSQALRISVCLTCFHFVAINRL